MRSDLAGALAPVVTRWYSFLPLVMVAVVVWRRHGLGRALALLAGGWVIAFAAEWSSTSGPGIPFGVYHYRPAGLTHDWLVAGVPVFDSLSFVWLAYCSYTLLGGLGARRGWRIVLAAAFMVGLDVVVDPVALRGAHWFLGSIYAYPRGAGVWYGVTLLNYLGWFVVSLVLQLLARFCLGETRPARSLAVWVSLALIVGVYVQSAVLALVLGVGPSAVVALAALLLVAGVARWRAGELSDQAVAPLVVACALSAEAAAIRAAVGGRWERNREKRAVRWSQPTGRVEVWETGMGQLAARAAALRVGPGSPVLVAGVAGACRGGWEPGDVGVASAVRTPSGEWVGADPRRTQQLVGAGAGRPCRLGSVEEIADSEQTRSALAAEGVDLVEMETAAWLGRDAEVVAVRVVLDTPGRPLGPAGSLLRLGGRGPAPELLLKLLFAHPGVIAELIDVGRRQQVALQALRRSVRLVIPLVARPAPPQLRGDPAAQAAGR